MPINKYQKGCFAKTYTELPENYEKRHWCDGMFSGNGLSGYVTSGAPYRDTFIFQNMFSCLHDARQSVVNLDDSWRLTETLEDGKVANKRRTSCYTFHPGPQLRITFLNSGKQKDYIRWTDYEAALTGVEFTDENGTWERTAFTSRPENVSVIKLKKSSAGALLSVDISLDNISHMEKPVQRPETMQQQYKKIVSEDYAYIYQVAHYPSFEQSELKDGGYAGVIGVFTDGEKSYISGGTKCSEFINKGKLENPKIRITNAEEIVLIVKCDRTYDMCKLEDFESLKSYALVESLKNDIKNLANKFSRADGGVDYDKLLSAQREVQSKEFNSSCLKLCCCDGELSNEEVINLQKTVKKNF